MHHFTLSNSTHPVPIDVAYPQEKTRGGVLILASIFGNDEGTLQLAQTLAQHGFLAVVPSLFFRTDAGPCGFDEMGKQRAYARMKGYQQHEGIDDLLHVVQWMREYLAQESETQESEAQEQKTFKIIGHGICFGGHLAGLLALQNAIDALSTVHGGRLNAISTQGELTVPAILHFGDQDHAISLADIDQVRHNWPTAKIVVHPQAQHGFAHPGAPAFIESAYQNHLEDLLTLI